MPGRRSGARRSASNSGLVSALKPKRPLPRGTAVSKRRVLVIAAHPDDELLGCGGTVALHTRAGDLVTAVIVCEGESLRYPQGVGQAEHTRRAAAALGVTDVRVLGFPDQKLDTFPLTDVIAPLQEIVREVRPRIVYGQFGGDANRDHDILF